MSLNLHLISGIDYRPTVRLPGPILIMLANFLKANDLVNLERSGFFGNQPNQSSEEVDLMFKQMSRFTLIVSTNDDEFLNHARQTLLRCGRKLVYFQVYDQRHEDITAIVCQSTTDFFKQLASISPFVEKFDHQDLYFQCLTGIVDYIKTTGQNCQIRQMCLGHGFPNDIVAEVLELCPLIDSLQFEASEYLSEVVNFVVKRKRNFHKLQVIQVFNVMCVDYNVFEMMCSFVDLLDHVDIFSMDLTRVRETDLNPFNFLDRLANDNNRSKFDSIEFVFDQFSIPSTFDQFDPKKMRGLSLESSHQPLEVYDYQHLVKFQHLQWLNVTTLQAIFDVLMNGDNFTCLRAIGIDIAEQEYDTEQMLYELMTVRGTSIKSIRLSISDHRRFVINVSRHCLFLDKTKIILNELTNEYHKIEQLDLKQMENLGQDAMINFDCGHDVEYCKKLNLYKSELNLNQHRFIIRHNT